MKKLIRRFIAVVLLCLLFSQSVFAVPGIDESAPETVEDVNVTADENITETESVLTNEDSSGEEIIDSESSSEEILTESALDLSKDEEKQVDESEESEDESFEDEEAVSDDALAEAADKIIVPEDDQYDESTMIVVFKDGTTKSEAVDVIENTEEVDVVDVPVVDDEPIAIVEVSNEVNFEDAAVSVAMSKEVEFVQPDFIYETMGDPVYVDAGTNDPLSKTGNWHIKAVRANTAWKYQKTNGAVSVAVLDTGCDLTHPDLKSNIDFANAYQSVDTNGRTFVNNGVTLSFPAKKAGKLTTSVGVNGDTSVNGHGTHVAGIIGASANNKVGIAGVSYNAKIVPVNVFNRGSDGNDYAFTSEVIRAYKHLFKQIDDKKLNNLRVINLSLGGYKQGGNDKILEDAIKLAEDKYKIVTVCAAGNSADKSSVRANGMTGNNFPADMPETVAVCGLAFENWKTNPTRLYSSDYNKSKNITAPAAMIYSTLPKNNYGFYNGTSMASPIVSSVFALVFAANPSLSAAAAKDIIYSTATDITGDANDPFNYDAKCAKGWDMYTGHGLVNAEKAVKKALGEKNPKNDPDEEKKETKREEESLVPVSDDIVDNGVYIIHSKLDHSMVLDIKGASLDNKANLQIYKSNGTNAQKFVFCKNSDGTYSIYSYRSGKAMDVKGNGSANFTNVHQYDANWTNAQKWTVKKNADGSYTFVGKGSGKVLDIAGAKTKNGTNVAIYQSNGTNAQKFIIERVDAVKFKPGVYNIRSALNRNFVFDIKGNSSSNKANLQLYKANNTGAQKFKIVLSVDGSYEIVTNHGKAIDVAGASTKPGANVWQYTRNGTAAQRYTVIKNGGGTYTLKSLCGGNVLEAKGGVAANGSNIQTGKSNNSLAQRFYLTKA